MLPAVLLVIVAVALWVHATAPAFDLAQRRQDLLWTLFYGSNWNLIASAQDSFAQFEGASLVRHTWSLGIEEMGRSAPVRGDAEGRRASLLHAVAPSVQERPSRSCLRAISPPGVTCEIARHPPWGASSERGSG